MKNLEIGKIGENLAYKYLINNSYLILSRNYKGRFYEIDIIASDKKGILIFCEVKTINNGNSRGDFMPEDNLTFAKRKKMIRGAEIFISGHPWLLRGENGWRIDLVAVVLKDERFFGLRHYKNI